MFQQLITFTITTPVQALINSHMDTCLLNGRPASTLTSLQSISQVAARAILTKRKLIKGLQYLPLRIKSMAHEVWSTSALCYLPTSFLTACSSPHSNLPGLLAVPLTCQCTLLPQGLCTSPRYPQDYVWMSFLPQELFYCFHHFVSSPYCNFIAFMTLLENVCVCWFVTCDTSSNGGRDFVLYTAVLQVPRIEPGT